MTLRRLGLLAVGGLFAVAVIARAEDGAVPPVRDEAELFSPEARQKADEELAGIRGAYHLDFLLETVAAPPDDVRKQLQAAKDNAQKDRILRAWGEQRADAAGAEGVHILICRDAGTTWYGRTYGYVAVTVLPAARGAFSEADAKALHDYLRWFSMGPNRARNDAMLRAALARVREDLAYNLRPPFPWLQVSGVLVGAFGLWGFLGLVGRRLRASAAVAGPAETGRLALYAGLLGGMFGTAATHWIYDTLFVVASRAVPAEDPMPVSTEADARSTPVGDPERVTTKAERLDLAARDESAEQSGRAAPASS